MHDILILNTGGTFNKRYDPVAGELFVPRDERAVEAALEAFSPNVRIALRGLIHKDSLQMDDVDRRVLCAAVAEAPERRIVVVHGTDTMRESAAALASAGVGERCVVFTGAMVPFSIDPVEATANLASAVTAAAYLTPGVYVAMHGLVLPYDRIRKNRERGVFERAAP